jgi:hypothetical protein
MKALALVACWIVFLAPAFWAGESVLYSVTDNSVSYPATNRPVKVSIPESKTDIVAIDPETGGKRLVFSDANATFLLLPGGTLGTGGIVAAGERIFAVAADRQDTANDLHSAAAVYELSTDGSGKARKIFDIDNFANLFVNPSGSKIGYMPGDSMETHVVIRDTATGKLLRNAELFSRTIDAEGVRKIGWMPEGTTIFFSITGGIDNDDALWTTRSSPIGTYVMNEDAGPAERLAPEATLHPKIAGLDPLPDAAAVLIGRLPDARYLLSDVEYSHTHPHQEKCLYALDVVQKTQKLFHLGVDFNPYFAYLSHSVKRLALTSTQQKVEQQPTYSVTSTTDVWVLELESGKQSKLFSFTTPDVTNTKGPWMNLIGWLQD